MCHVTPVIGVINSWIEFFQVLFFSTMTRLLDVMEDYLTFKQYRYLRLDGHTSGGDRGALIDKFNQQDSPFFIFLLRYNIHQLFYLFFAISLSMEVVRVGGGINH